MLPKSANISLGNYMNSAEKSFIVHPVLQSATFCTAAVEGRDSYKIVFVFSLFLNRMKVHVLNYVRFGINFPEVISFSLKGSGDLRLSRGGRGGAIGYTWVVFNPKLTYLLKEFYDFRFN